MSRKMSFFSLPLRYVWLGMLGTGILVICIVIVLEISGQQNDNTSITERLSSQLAMQQKLDTKPSTSTLSLEQNAVVPHEEASNIQLVENADNEQQIKQQETDVTIEANRTVSTSSEALEQAQIRSEGNGKININSANVEQLQQLKGIGPSKAQAIIDDRNLKGNFKHIQDLKRVKGIGDKLYEGVKESIVAEP